MQRYKPKAILCLAFLLIPVLSFAQEGQQGGREGFFSRDYVNEGFKGKGDEISGSATAAPENKAESDVPKRATNNKEADFKELGQTEDNKEKADAKETEVDIFAEGQGLAIKSLGVIVDGTKDTSLKEVLRNFGRLVKVRKLNPGSIFLVGEYSYVLPNMEKNGPILTQAFEQETGLNTPSEASTFIPTPLPEDTENIIGLLNLLRSYTDVTSLFAIFTNLRISSTIPSAYSVKLLPTWILGTDSGDVVLEGLRDPSPYISQKGEFVAASIQMFTKE